MNKKLYIFFLLLVVLGANLSAQSTITVKDGDLVGGQTYNWTKNNVYLLDGSVFLEAGGVLNIEAGTVIKGKESPTTGDNASALIITRGAQIFARGTAGQPIIFTAEIDDTDDPADLNETDRGLWGGLIILGRAAIADNTTEVGIEGIPAGDPRALYGAPTAAEFKDDDNSGVLQYVSIRHGGAEIGAGNEINGLTLGAVGNGTTIDHIEVFANFDDGIEFFGGTVAVKYASIAFCGDDSFDWDTGFRGKGQFWFSLQAEDDGDNGSEDDGAIPDANLPFSQPTIYNATFIGAGLNGTAPNEHALLMRDATGGYWNNSIFTSFRNFAIQVEDLPAASGVDSRKRLEDGDLALRNNIWWEFGSGSQLKAGADGIIKATTNAEDPNAQFLIDHLSANGNTLENPQLGGIARTANGGLDPRPNRNGPAYGGSVAAYPSDPFFTEVGYKGAFGGTLWLRGWTALDEYGYIQPAQEITIRDEDLVGGQTYTWTSDNVYLLDGSVFLEEGGKLNIEAGTVIKGKESPSTGDNASALIITRGAQICAKGTADNPVIFTAEIDDTNDPNDLTETDRGLWGGLILLGRATIADNTTEVGIEGIPAGDPRALYGAPTAAEFKDDDNSGILQYVSIRHGGAEIGAGNEINGLTLGAVGSGTTIDHIEVFANFDDGIEFFGGTVSVKYAIIAFCGDDSFDWDTGFRGKGQFWFSLQGVDDGDNGSEDDGAIPDANLPFSQPTIYNATFIGAGLNGTAPNEHALLMRDATGGYWNNSIFTSFRNFAIQVEDLPAASGVDSRKRLENGELALRNNIWWEFGSGSQLKAGADGIIKATTNAEDPNAQFLISHLTSNANSLENPQLGGVSRTTDGGLDPRPAANGPAYGNLYEYPNDPFFTPVQFRGAFCNDGVWFKGWTAVSEYGVLNGAVPSASDGCDTQVATNVITIKDEDLVGGQTYTWTKDNIYLLDGSVFLEEGGKLNIEAGTIIKGKESPTTGDNASALIITRGAQICAKGTVDSPVIFTAEIDDVNDPSDLNETDRGLWGGLIILGRATIADNTTEVGIEGIPAGDPRALYGAPTAAEFKDDDNSGILEYVSIRHGGAEIGAGNEINGLTLGAVGSGTTINHVEVFANFDDGIEFFGGTVAVKYAAIAFCGDDSFDWDTGFRGKGQFWFSLQAADDGDNGSEDDGAIPDANLPFSQPTIYNATFIGAGLDGTAPNEHALLMRDATGGYWNNSIFTSFRNFAIQVEDLPAASGVDSRKRLENGELALRNNIWWEFGSGTQLKAGTDGIIKATNNAEDPSAQFLVDHLVGNGNTLENPQLGGISRTANGGLDPRPLMSGPAYANLAANSGDSFFTPVLFKGAFCGQGVWLKGWTALDTYGYLNPSVPGAPDNCDLTGVINLASVSNGYVLAQSMPNPAADRMMIAFELPKTSTVTLTISDLSGRQLSRVIDNTSYITGKHQVEVNTSNLPNGLYVYSLQTGSVVLTRKFVVKR